MKSKFYSNPVFVLAIFFLMMFGITTISVSSSINNSYMNPRPAEVDPPVFISTPSNMSVLVGVWFDLAWHIQDANSDNYTLYENGTIYSVGDLWSNNLIVSINIGGQSPGIYNYTLEAVDTFGNRATDTVWVTVYTVGVLGLSSPPDITYEIGSVGNTIQWIPRVPASAFYDLFVNDGRVQGGSAWNNSEIKIDLSDFIFYYLLEVGTHNLTLLLTDNSDNTVMDTVIVTVKPDTTPPTIDSPLDITFEVGSKGNEILWNTDDRFPANYTIIENQEIYETGSWFSVIRIDIDDLPVGIHNFEVIIADESGNTASDSVTVSVTGESNSQSTSQRSTIEFSITNSNERITSSTKTSDGPQPVPIANLTISIFSIMSVVFIRNAKRKNQNCD